MNCRVMGNNVEHGSFLVVLDSSGYADNHRGGSYRFPTPCIVCAYLSRYTCRAMHSLYLDLHLAFRYVIRQVYGGFHVRKRYVFCRVPTWSKCRGFIRTARRESSWASCTRTRGLCTTVSAKAPRSLVSLNYSLVVSRIYYTCNHTYSGTYITHGEICLAMRLKSRSLRSLHDDVRSRVDGRIEVNGESANKKLISGQILSTISFYFIYDVTFRF